MSISFSKKRDFIKSRFLFLRYDKILFLKRNYVMKKNPLDFFEFQKLIPRNEQEFAIKAVIDIS